MSASPPSIAQLAGLRVALWGWGREGRAAYAALRGARESGIGNGESGERFPTRLTLFCTAAEAEEARALGDGALLVETEASAERLSAFDVVVKSPGISPYRPEAVAAAAQGTRFIGGTVMTYCRNVGIQDAELLGTLAQYAIMTFVFAQPMTGFIVSSGIVIGVVGLAMQSSLSDLVSGVAISIERPFRMGDWIELENRGDTRAVVTHAHRRLGRKPAP